jgi:hypothetical protein
MKYVVAAFLLFVLFSCNETKPSPEIPAVMDRAAITLEVKQTLSDYAADIRKNGLTAELNYLDSSADFFWVPPGYASPITFDSVAAILRLRAPAYQEIDNVWDTLQVMPLTNELASYTGRLKSTMTDTAGHSATYTLVETGLMVKRGGTWKLRSGQTSVVR